MSIRVERSEVHPSGPPPPGRPGASVVRLVGVVLAGGAVGWGVALLSVGGGQDLTIHAVDMLTSSVYLVGLVGLCVVVALAGAAGAGRGRWLAWAPMALLPFGVVTNTVALGYTSYADVPGWMKILDLSWPLSQLAVLVMAVAIARVGRWRGPLRWLPLGGALWLVSVMAVRSFAPPMAAAWFFLVWMTATYGALGALLAARPEAARGRC
ncbi:hypothetical protein LO762_11035 [Actinocorallia sp. API 0066]|uniref:hypothetical protein n=1 Tax=Actinocorallia sp. API 0066 TaxID=2896846 RepID=UPI001E43FE4E|nr:hypothetical protein [Actinocorallia sp. API 0066]MCD0449719.1 hypothetical protein [Actinocorallia sp. API 0066]